MGKPKSDTAGSRLMRDVLAAYQLDPREHALLERAAGIADQLERIEAVLAREPLSTDGSAHGLLKSQAELAGRLQRLLGDLELPHKGERPAGISKQQQRAAQIRWARQKAAGS